MYTTLARLSALTAATVTVAVAVLAAPRGIEAQAVSRRSESTDATTQPLTTPTVGGPEPRVVATPSGFSLSLDADLALGGFVFKDGVPFLHNDGGATYYNTALGLNALVSATLGVPNSFSGGANSALGYGALYANTTGSRNTALGDRALVNNTSGARNVAVGHIALYSNTAGGGYAPAEGKSNTAVGTEAMALNESGSYNTAIGFGAGRDWTTGTSNIAVGRGADGATGESGTIRIGGGGLQDRVFIEGISDAVGVFDDHDVCIEGDQLGPCSSSSARFKTAIEPLVATPTLADLQPVSFRYKKEMSGEEDPMLRYGLIAEQVAELFPSLVGHDPEGRPSTVRYDLLTPLLLAEVQRLGEAVRNQQEEIEELRRLVTVRSPSQSEGGS